MSLGNAVARGWAVLADKNVAAPVTALSAGLVSVAAATPSANAQTTPAPSAQLPPVEVVTKRQARPKRAPAAKKRAPAAPVAPAPAPQAQTTAPPSASVPGVARDGGYKIDQIGSTAMTGPLLDTPQTVTVVPGTIIREQGARNLTEVLRATPGITFDAGENGFATSTNNFKIRGFDGSGNIFIDGMRSSGSYPRDAFNIEQVEVVKGAAADNGRGGAGGYVNMVTKTPQLGNFIRGDARIGFDEYHSEIRKRSTIDVNQNVGNVAVRLNGMVEDGGVAGRDVAESKGWGVAPSLAFGLGTPFRVILAYEHLDRNDLPDWGVPGAMIKGMINYNPTAAARRRDTFFGLKSDYDDIQADSVLARVEYDLSRSFTLSNQTRWSQVDRNAGYTIPTGYTAATAIVSTQRQYYSRSNETISNQTNLAGTFFVGGLKNVVSTGIEVTRETSDALRYRTENAGNVSIFAPNPNRARLGVAPEQTNGIQIDTVAGYLYDTLHLSRQWQLTGGVRVERYNVSMDSKAFSGAVQPQDGFETSATTVGGKVGLVYKPTDNVSYYAAFGVSHLPPGSYLSNPDISRTGNNAFPGFVPTADPTELHNYEVGTKWDWFGGALTTTAAVFRTEKRNAPIMGRDVGETVDTLKGYGQQVVQGIELSAAGKITHEWKVFGGVAFIDSWRKHSAYLDAARKRGGNGAGDYGPAIRTSGDELAFTPNITGTLWTTYDLTKALTIGGGIQYSSESWLGRPDDANRIIPSGRFGKLPSYVVANFMTSYALTKNVDIRLNVDNVFDKTYAVTSNWAGSRATLGPPRTFWLSTGVKF